MVLDLRSLPQPMVVAPMAGGPSTPALAAATSNAGALGMLAAGYKTAEQVGDEIDATRRLTECPFGVNLFVPTTNSATRSEAAVAEYARHLGPLATRFDVTLPRPRWDDTDSFDAKLEVLINRRVPLVSTVFGVPPRDAVAALHGAGAVILMTVTDADEALAAVRGGADALCIQGYEAGGHRGTHTVDAIPNDRSWSELLREISCVTTVPLIVAGGIGTAAEVRRALSAGAAAVQCGTAFLLADEAGTSLAHRAALVEDALTSSGVTRAFSGRCARGIRNEFMTQFSDQAPAVFPIVDQLTKPIRAAAAAAGDYQYVSAWAGTRWRDCTSTSARAIVEQLCA